MSKTLLNNLKNLQFQFLLISLAVLFILRIMAGDVDSVFMNVLIDLLLLITFVFLGITLITNLKKKQQSALSISMNIGIVNAVLFFAIAFSDSILLLFISESTNSFSDGMFASVISISYVLFITGLLVYLITSLRHLYFLKQGNNKQVYFNTMLVLFVLAAISTTLFDLGDLSFISNTFFIVSLILIFFNSIKISWIAFIVKKEKILLLALSIVITVLFIFNLINSSDETLHNKLLSDFSPSLNTFANITMLFGATYFAILFFTTLFHIPTAEAFDRKAQEVSSLQYFSKLINQVLDFDDLAETITDIALRIGNADASWMLWKDNENYNSGAIKGAGFLDTEIINKYITEKIKWENFEGVKVFNVGNIRTEEKIKNKFQIAAASPIRSHGGLNGILITACKSNNEFNEEDRSAINTFAEYASVSLENSRLLEQSIEKERLEKELDVAREIQKKILPEKNPLYPGLEISSMFIPAFEVGGDYYDFFPISDTKLGFVIADVSGKGISAAFIMAEVKGIFHSLSKTIESPKDILIKANEILIETLDSKSFVSAAYGLIDVTTGSLQLSRAGHCPVLHIRADVAKSIRPSGMGLGMSNSDYFISTLEQTEIFLNENDTIVLFTDGITEAKNHEFNDFGERYFTEILLENRDKSADEIANRVIEEVSLFSKNHSQYDDLTLVILKWKSKIKTDGEKVWQNSAHQL